MQRKKAFLALEDGTIYPGNSFGYEENTQGEVVFNTGLTGYQEVLTDPSYCGQIVTMTYPQIGNYGYIEDDVESGTVQVRGFIVRENCENPSNYRSKSKISEYLKANKITAIEGLDTRALTKRLRNSGTMRGMIILDDISEKKMIKMANEVEDISKIDLVKRVSTVKEYYYAGNGLNIGIIDYGMKYNIARNFNNLGHSVTVLPATYDADKVLAKKFDLVLLSNGPGDPRIVTYGVKLAQELFGKVPLTGICLGLQILGLALGGEIYKLKFGHRGGNHPVKNMINNKVYITTQNHGYVIDKNTLPKNAEVTHINLNDNTVEGFRCVEKNVYCVQFHPEAAPGPQDCYSIFSEFINFKGNSFGNI